MLTRHKTSYRSRSLSFIIVAVAIVAGTASSFSIRVNAQTTAGRVPLTHETMWMMKRVGAPTPSPDGKWVRILKGEDSRYWSRNSTPG